MAGSDISALLARGGEDRVALLRYCVMSVTMDPVFVFLAREYRLRPTREAALALYDVFCASEAPARVTAHALLPPRDLRLTSACRLIRQQVARVADPQQGGDGAPPPDTAPHRSLFDFLGDALEGSAGGGFAKARESYDPGYPPEHSLPGGRMNAAQKHFVERVWRPAARPRLAAAGFWQIACIE